MKLSSRIFSLALPLAAMSLSACAGDPNKEVKEAHEEKREDQRSYQVTQAELNREQSTDQSKTDRKQGDERVNAMSDHQQTMSADNQKIAEANAKMMEDRRTTAAKTTERINKADAEANELFTKARALPPAKKVYFDGAWTNYTKRRDAAVSKSSLTNDATNEGWAQAKVEIEKSLDDLEKSVSEVKRTSKP